MSLLKKKEVVPRAKAKAVGKAASVLRAVALALGTEGLTGGPDRLCAESLLTQLSAKEPSSGPLVSSVPRVAHWLSAQEWGPPPTGATRRPTCAESRPSALGRSSICAESLVPDSRHMCRARNSRRQL
jgi:hypothetical protein